MVQINGLKSVAVQTFNAQSPNGDGVIYFTLTFRPRIQAWYLDVSFGNYSVNGYKVVRGPNIFSHYRNTFGFGISISTSDMGEPMMINDFSSGRVGLFLLTGAECDQVQSLIESGALVG